MALAAGALGPASAPSASAATARPSGAVRIRQGDGSTLSKNILHRYGAHHLSGGTGTGTG
ncbi:hypothetical protein [Streptomyces griseoviridis]|uniref:Pectate lyase n=2 Tax=Streptomyces TaxID=1883 RepID=A0ABT9LDV9_STRGD|nr:hypothetical protein [Streptomyces griseoviridis]MDP9681899.1 hypothetical protein [Streptomyces griseoviridis]GGT04011.1 hypothetical protein GCM10010240_41820 [Streptomyces griseoviridis]